jgi:hypothetical protein
MSPAAADVHPHASPELKASSRASIVVTARVATASDLDDIRRCVARVVA